MELRNLTTEARWRTFAEDPSRVPPALRAALDDGRPILLASRFSTPTGEDARTSAINSLFEAARVLERQTGIDVERALPSREDLDLRLQAAPITVSQRLQKGDALRHRFVTLDLRPEVPVIILMATGSGRLAAEGFVQPFTRAAADLVWEHEVALVATKRWDRTTRNDQLVGPLLMSMEHHRSWVCTDRLLREMNGETRLVLMVESYAAGSNTGGEDHAKRLGQADRTDRTMVGGQAAYHLASTPAPGLGVATRKRRPHSPVERLVYLDTPACRPDPKTIADGLSDVRGPDGEVVDQVENVRFFLANYGRPEWMAEGRLQLEMSRRRFSTVHVRRMYGADAHMTSSVGHTAWQSILANLDLYETGILRRSVGGSVGDVEIVGVMPPDGPWATPEDFARIRAQLARGQQRAGAKRRTALSGIPATYDGNACRTRIAFPSSQDDDTPLLAFNTGSNGDERRVPNHIAVPVETFAESIADGLIAASGSQLQPLLDTFARAGHASRTENEARADELAQQIADVDRRIAALTANLGETGPDGTPVLRGALLQQVQTQYDELDRQRILLRAEQDQLAAAHAETAPTGTGTEASALPALLASLRDPYDTTHAGLWSRIIVGLTLTSSSAEDDGTRTLRWSGAIRVSDDAGDLSIPFTGSHSHRRTRNVHERRHRALTDRYLDAMTGGTPFGRIDLPNRTMARTRLAERLDIAPDHPIFTCEDPEIMRVATALLRQQHDPAQAIPDIDAGRLDAIRRVHLDDRTGRPWQRPVREVWRTFYDLAAHDGTVTIDQVLDRTTSTRAAVHTAAYELRQHDPNWTSLRRRGYQLAACPHCGSHDRHPATIAEITGLYCHACERDEAGTRWPAITYGRYAGR